MRKVQVNMEYEVYTYDELSKEAKERVKEDYLEKSFRDEEFFDYIKEFLETEFPKSSLDVEYSLSYCQGDGLNIYGKFNLYDFIDKWEATDKQKRAMNFYINQSYCDYIFSRNNHYGYSCKFIDREDCEASVDEFIEEMEYQQMKNINRPLIEKFFNDMINYFEDLDSNFEREGYEYLYEISDEEMESLCECNEWEFTEDGNIF